MVYFLAGIHQNEGKKKDLTHNYSTRPPNSLLYCGVRMNETTKIMDVTSLMLRFFSLVVTLIRFELSVSGDRY